MAAHQLSLEQLRLLPDDDRVDWLRAAAEGQWLERKGPRIRAKALDAAGVPKLGQREKDIHVAPMTPPSPRTA